METHSHPPRTVDPTTKPISQVFPYESTHGSIDITMPQRFTMNTYDYEEILKQRSIPESISPAKETKRQRIRERFAEAFVILGIKRKEFLSSKGSMVPNVVDTYPRKSKADMGYLDNMIWICFPEGFKVDALSKENSYKLTEHKIFHFIITNQDGDKKYISSILFREILHSKERGSCLIPKSMCIVSRRPIFNVQRQLKSILILPQPTIKPNLHQSDSPFEQVSPADTSRQPQEYGAS
ncbi:hypothetical protein FGO68_gene1493 [Halteria grandinella]|uniref:uDENN domain-containing protein n=1 Tax=Halteria grandinella TaxID=5974 RepID=A0A8J8P290_HALGN|nr:hypothetical protein FGO68_gene1493 [Halteria grandinella]